MRAELDLHEQHRGRRRRSPIARGSFMRPLGESRDERGCCEYRLYDIAAHPVNPAEHMDGTEKFVPCQRLWHAPETQPSPQPTIFVEVLAVQVHRDDCVCGDRCAAEESPLVAEHVKFAQIWKALPKVVFSTTLQSVVGNTRLARDGVGEEVSRAQGTAREGHRRRRRRSRPCVYEAGSDRRVAAVRQPGPTRRRHTLLPSPGERDQPRADRDTDLCLSCRLRSIPGLTRALGFASRRVPLRTRCARKSSRAAT